jgi:hypothetical protein
MPITTSRGWMRITRNSIHPRRNGGEAGKRGNKD